MSNPFSSIQNLLQRFFSPKIVTVNGEYVVQYDLVGVGIDRISTNATGTISASGVTQVISDTRVSANGVILITLAAGQAIITQQPFVNSVTAGVGFTASGLTAGRTYSYVLIN